jgi:hypothetical protein
VDHLSSCLASCDTCFARAHGRKSRGGGRIPPEFAVGGGTLIQVIPPDFCNFSKFQALAMDSSPPDFNPDLRHCLSTIAQSNLFFQIIDLLKEASKPLDRRTLIDLLPSLKYDDLLPPVAALPPVSCLPGRLLSTELPVVALHTRWSVLARHCVLVRHLCRTCRPFRPVSSISLQIPFSTCRLPTLQSAIGCSMAFRPC